MNVKKFFVFGLLGAGCAVGEAEPGEAEPVMELREAPFDLGVEDEVCPKTRHILWRKEEGECPKIGNWLGQRLFGEGTDYLAGRDVPLSGELAKVCRYEWGIDGSVPSQNAIDNLYERPIFADAGSDCEVVFPQATIHNDAITDQIDYVLEDVFHDAIGRMDGKALDLAQTETARRRVHVIIADTQPHAEPPDPRTKHGEAISRMVESIVCPDGPAPCAVSVERVLAMPRWAGGVDPARGGYYGSFGDAAAAIKESVERWREVNVGAAVPSQLVINFSAGWHPYAALGSGGAGERAVKLAIEAARCAGAIIVAAAGNEDTFCAAVPLMPAGWEQDPAPDATRCGDVGGPAPAYAGSYRPLVHSVGGLDPHGDEIANSREGGRPRLAAAGSYALVDAGTQPTPALTGTSISSGLGAAVAGLVWSYNGKLSADQVMDALYTGGYALDEPATADYGLGSAPAIHRVDACGALQEACGTKCPKTIDFASCDGGAWPDGEDVVDAIDALKPTATASPKFSPAVTVCPKACGGEIALHTVTGGTPECARAEVYTRDRMISPQPDTPLCQSCGLKVSSTSHTDASLNADFTGATVEDLVIEVEYADGVTVVYDYDDTVQLSPEDTTQIDLPELEEGTEIEEATVTITLDNGYTQTDPLVLEEEPFLLSTKN